MNRDDLKLLVQTVLANGGSLDDEEGAAEELLETLEQLDVLRPYERGNVHREPRIEDPKFVAGIDMVRRTGATDVQIRYSDDEDPVVWMVVAAYQRGKHRGYQAAGALEPLDALMRLCEALIDGEPCTHCGRPAIFLADIGDVPTVYDALMCQYQFDPELATFRRSCEAEHPRPKQ